MQTVDELKEMTEQLPPVPKLEELISNPGNKRHYIEYKVEDGTAIGFGLLSQCEVGVQKLFISSGTIFPEHVHNNEIEYGIVYNGKLKVTINENSRIIEKGDYIKFSAQEVHDIEALEDSWIIAISIPKIEGYPNF